jgi:hypothetical protein
MLAAVHPTLSRRRLLVGGLCLPVLATTACTDDPEQPPLDPDRVALESALNVEVGLLMLVGNLKAEGRDTAMVFGAVEEHVDALDAALGQPPSTTYELAPLGSPSPSPSDSPSSAPTPSAFATADEAIRTADRAVNAHLRALRSASAEITPLLASLAASDAAVAAYLRGREV